MIGPSTRQMERSRPGTNSGDTTKFRRIRRFGWTILNDVTLRRSSIVGASCWKTVPAATPFALNESPNFRGSLTKLRV